MWHMGDMVHIRPSHGNQWHLIFCPAMACILTQKKSVESVCNQEVAACFTLAFAANRLSARCSPRGPKRWKSLGPILPTIFVTGYGTVAGRLWTTLLNSSDLVPIDFHLFGCPKKHLAVKRFATDARSCHLLTTDT